VTSFYFDGGDNGQTGQWQETTMPKKSIVGHRKCPKAKRGMIITGGYGKGIKH